ncbi:MAG TPA: oxygen-independent coproporphyrinogen III oxidase [Opitutaceae bacterium]|nr:oxygen-independent coproporphyrinogen III oxidase [Opitutaceae bacterium]
MLSTALPVSAREPPSAAIINPELIRKYSVPGPRYTSYPSANHFSPDLEPVAVERALREDNETSASPLSLYFHLPFCESRCWFCGCNTVITRRKAEAADYLDVLVKEIELTASRMDRRRPVTQIHLGGGTPTFFPPDQLRRLGEVIEVQFPNRSESCEFSVEIDPRRLTEDHVVALSEMGATRASLGVQDTHPSVQLAIHRFQPHALNQQAFDWLGDHGFSSINVDLIYGLPLQTEASFSQTIDAVLALEPDRLSVFGYAHIPWIKPAQKIFDARGQLPGPETRLAMFLQAHRQLTAAGFVDIGLDHFARLDDTLALALKNGTLHRNFQGYSTGAEASLYGFGMSSISATRDTYRQNHKGLDEWCKSVMMGQLPVERGWRLTEEDQRRRWVIMALMCTRRLNFQEASDTLGVNFKNHFRAELERALPLMDDGLIAANREGLYVTSAGSPLLRVIAALFDEHFRSAGGHSKVI